jgi:hypothetical protein
MRFKVPAQQPASFKASALYLAGLIRGKSSHRVEFVEARNLSTTDPRTASAMMDAVAAKSVRCKQPQYHFIITFDPKDAAAGKISEDLKRKVAGQIVERMALGEHQSLVYLHQDTDHPHLHFLVNRVHPTKHVAYDRHNDGRRLKEIVKELALEHGLNVLKDRDLDRGIDRHEGRSGGPSPSDAEYWRARREGREAQTPFSKEELRHLRTDLQAHFYAARSWDDLGLRLEERGILLERKGQGLMLSDGERHAKLSDMGKGIRLRELEERFGEEFDGYVARRASDLVKRLGDDERRFSGMNESERRTVAAMDSAERDAEGADPVAAANVADLDARYWSQVGASYRASRSHIASSQRDERTQGAELERARRPFDKESRRYKEVMTFLYRDPKGAWTAWLALEREHGLADALKLVSRNPTVLGIVKGVDILDERAVEKAQARKAYSRLVTVLDRWNQASSRLRAVQKQLDAARNRTQLAIRQYELFKTIVGDDERLRQIMVERIRRRMSALDRLNEKAIRESKLTKERKEQLSRAFHHRQEQRKEQERDRPRRHERSRGHGLQI